MVSYAAPFAIPAAADMPGAAQLATAIYTESGHFAQYDTVRTRPPRGSGAARVTYANGLLTRRGPDTTVYGGYGLADAAMGSGAI